MHVLILWTWIIHEPFVLLSTLWYLFVILVIINQDCSGVLIDMQGEVMQTKWCDNTVQNKHNFFTFFVLVQHYFVLSNVLPNIPLTTFPLIFLSFYFDCIHFLLHFICLMFGFFRQLLNAQFMQIMKMILIKILVFHH